MIKQFSHDGFTSKNQQKRLVTFQKLIDELNTKEIPEKLSATINVLIDQLNTYIEQDQKLIKEIRKAQTTIVKTVEKELKIVPKNYYQNLWMGIGIGGFGIPMGVAFGAALDNMAFIGIGLPIGLALGIAIGASMDKKAFNEGRQLDIEISF